MQPQNDPLVLYSVQLADVCRDFEMILENANLTDSARVVLSHKVLQRYAKDSPLGARMRMGDGARVVASIARKMLGTACIENNAGVANLLLHHTNDINDALVYACIHDSFECASLIIGFAMRNEVAILRDAFEFALSACTAMRYSALGSILIDAKDKLNLVWYQGVRY